MLKILPAYERTKNIVLNSKQKFYDSQKQAKELGIRAAKIYNKKEKSDSFIRASRVRSALKEITPTNMPIILFLVGVAIPLPFTSVILGTIGCIGGFGLYIQNKLNKH